jgi:predicted metal-dependent HD superfamily phosphohydrolase
MVTPAKANWLEFWQQLGVRSDPASCFLELEARYAEPHRAYHNLTHIQECLAEFAAARHLARDPVAVEAAIWYHDAVYDPRAKDNEEQSASLAAQVGAATGWADTFQRRVAQLILATKKHDAALEVDAPLLVDVDLSILGRDRERFDEYERQIRREYDWVADDAFAAGRMAVLQIFLTRPKIYNTDFFRDKYETQARENLKHSIHRLQTKTLS